MPKKVKCLGCGRLVELPEAEPGTVLRCPHCEAFLGMTDAMTRGEGCRLGAVGCLPVAIVVAILGEWLDVAYDWMYELDRFLPPHAQPLLFLVSVALVVLGSVTWGRAVRRDRSGSGSARLACLRGAALIGVGAAVFLLLMLPARSRPRAPARRTVCRNNLHQLAVALENYREVHGAYPPAVTYGPDGKAMHGWGVNLLPFIEEAPLYREYDPTKPWDHPDNAKVVGTYIEQFECPSAGGLGGPENSTHYRLVVCPGSVIRPRHGGKREDITDRPYQTILVVECVEPVPWASPQAVVDLTRGINRPGGASSKHERGVFAGMADGSVRWLPEDIDHMTLMALCTANGGETIDESDY